MGNQAGLVFPMRAFPLNILRTKYLVGTTESGGQVRPGRSFPKRHGRWVVKCEAGWVALSPKQCDDDEEGGGGPGHGVHGSLPSTQPYALSLCSSPFNTNLGTPLPLSNSMRKPNPNLLLKHACVHQN